jgi:small subunit ribosomal protein S6e
MDDERKLHSFYAKCTATEIAAKALIERWKGNVVQIRSKNHKEGVPMKQGVLAHSHVHE